MLFIHARLIAETGGATGLRDLGLLEATVARPHHIRTVFAAGACARLLVQELEERAGLAAMMGGGGWQDRDTAAGVAGVDGGGSPMTNRWNRIIYRLWAPVYDLFFARRGFAQARCRALARLDVQPGERVILPGVGTGADLPNLPAGAVAVGVDISPAMLAQAQRKLARVAATVWLIQGDVQQMPLASGVFDAAALHLILSVAPDGHACVLETRRLLRRDGRCVIFDKFLPAGAASPALRRRWLSQLAMLVGTDLNRRLDVLLAGSGWVVVWQQPALFGGVYRVFALEQEEG